MNYLFHDGIFYVKEVHGDNIPSDARRVSEDEYKEALQKRSEGFDVIPGLSGEPTYIKPQVKAFESSDLCMALVAEMSRRLDELAKSLGYVSCVDLISYNNSGLTESKALAKSMIKYRDIARAYIKKSSEEYQQKEGDTLAKSVLSIMAGFPQYNRVI